MVVCQPRLTSRYISVLKKCYLLYRAKPESGLGLMNNTNICWECKHDTLKLKILVPYNRTIKEYVHKTGDFHSDIVAISKEKQGQYNIWFRSEGNLRLLSFRMLHVCKLKQEEEKSDKVGACENYDFKNDQNSISNIIYSKMSSPQQK
jgi:hypothetical protein